MREWNRARNEPGMKKTLWFLALGLLLFFSPLYRQKLWAQSTGPWGFRLDFQTGLQDPSARLGYFQATRLLLDRQDSLSDDLDLNVGAEALWWAQGPQGPPANSLNLPWPEPGTPNWVSVEWNNFNDSDGVNFEVLRLTRLNLRENFDGFEAVAGLQTFNWGQGHFFKPTDYFNPLAPLSFWGEAPLGSEGLDLSQALFDDLSVEAAARLTAGAKGEWVIRFPNRGIGFLAVPSFARLAGRDALGLEGYVTFPTFQIRAEAVRWAFAAGGSAVEALAGVSTRVEDGDLCLEWLKDGTGEALGGFSNRNGKADYFYFSLSRALDKRFSLDPAFVKSPEGGPFLFWPKAVLNFGTGWQFSLEARVSAAFSEGPLAVHSDRFLLGLAYEF